MCRTEIGRTSVDMTDCYKIFAVKSSSDSNMCALIGLLLSSLVPSTFRQQNPKSQTSKAQTISLREALYL